MTLDRRHLLFALLLHLALFGLLFTGVQCSRQIEAPPVMQGVLVNPSDLPKLDAAKPKPQTDQPPTPTPPTPTPPKPEPPQPDNSAAQKQVEAQQQAKAAADAQAAAAAKAAAEAKAKAEVEATQKEKAELEAKAKADAAAKAKDDLAKQTAEEEQERKAAAAKQAAAERKQREQELQQQLGQESQAINQAVLAEWNAALTAAITRNWAKPPGIDPTLKCKLHLNLSPAGQVLSASVVTGSGNALFDSSVLAAVYKASPLPLPRDPTVFQPGINVYFSPP